MDLDHSKKGSSRPLEEIFFAEGTVKHLRRLLLRILWAYQHWWFYTKSKSMSARESTGQRMLPWRKQVDKELQAFIILFQWFLVFVSSYDRDKCPSTPEWVVFCIKSQKCFLQQRKMRKNLRCLSALGLAQCLSCTSRKRLCPCLMPVLFSSSVLTTGI